MPFWIFKKKEAGEGKPEVILPVEDKMTRLEEDMQFLVDYFNEITRELSKVEHNAAVSENELEKIGRTMLNFRKLVRKLIRNESEFHVYWNNFSNMCEDYVAEVRKILPNSMYELPLDQSKVEEVGRISRRRVSDFISLLEDVKKRLNKTYKRTFNVSWPRRSAFQ